MNFKIEEFNSKDGAVMPEVVIENIKELMKNLQVLRDFYNKPITINSGYRSPEHNKKIGGVQNSQHVLGKAADIVVKGEDPADVARTIEMLIRQGKMKQGGVGRYRTFTHYDIGFNGKKRRWIGRY